MTVTELNRDVAEVFVSLLDPVARYLGAWGGRGGAKSHFFAEQMIEDAWATKGLLSVCIREVQKSLAQSSKRLIESKLAKFGLGEADGFKVFRDVIETPGDGIIIFNGMQDHTADSIKSLEGFHRGWWEEAQNATAYSLGILRPSFFRVPGCQLWFSWNPKAPPDPEKPDASVDGLLRGKYPPPGTVVVEAQFTDNPWFNDTDLALEEAHDRAHLQAEDYAHRWRGAYSTRSAARVFQNWRQLEFTTPDNATFRFGADFGFSIDPSVLVRMFIGRWLNDDPASGVAVEDPKGRTLFIDHEAYRVGCDVDHTPALFAGNDVRDVPEANRWKNPYQTAGIPEATKWPIIADSARPETISYMTRNGFPRMKAARKGAGSVEDGIEFLKGYDIVVHTRCKHTADEFMFYSWKVDKITGAILPVLEDKKNHVIDAARYAVEDVRRPRGFFEI